MAASMHLSVRAIPERAGRSARVGLGERGMVTAETAMALPALMVITAGLLFVIGAVDTHLRCVDDSREAVRELARGDDQVTVTQRVLAAAPADTRLTISRANGMVTATVTARAPVFGAVSGPLRGVVVAASSSALDEAAIGVQP